MARNITVTFDDGSNHVFQNAPDDITPGAVQQRAESQFNKKVSGIDGGKQSTPEPLKLTPEQIAEHSNRAEISSYRGENPIRAGLHDFLGGVNSTVRGALNIPGRVYDAVRSPTLPELVTGKQDSPNFGDRLLGSKYENKESLPAIAGKVLDPTALAVGGGVIKAAQYAPMLRNLAPIAQNIVGGAVGGGAVSALQGDDATTGAVVGGVVPVALSGAGRLAGKVVDIAKGNRTKLAAKKVIEDVAGDALPAVRAGAMQSPTGVTAAQAAAPAQKDTFSALGDLAATKRSQYFTDIAAEQEANRISRLEGVNPGLKASADARDAVSGINYNRAFASDAQRVADAQAAEQVALKNNTAGLEGFSPKPLPPLPAVAAMEGNPIIDAAAREADILARSKSGGKGLGDPRSSLEGLHYMKLAIDNQFKNRSASTALQNYSDDALRSTKQALLDAIEGTANKPGISPAYGLARQQHAEMSKPVNQSAILDEMVKVLRNPSGGERVAPFMNVMGSGESALLKRADQTPRFGGISDHLTTPQMDAVNAATSELRRDIELKKRAAAGQGELADILRKNTSSFRIPNFMNAKATVANTVLDKAEAAMNEKVMEQVYKAMQSGKNLTDILNSVPFANRNMILNTLKNGSQVPYTMGANAALAEQLRSK